MTHFLKNGVRRLLRRLCIMGLYIRSRPLETPREGTTLILAPHSDDEALGCGALLARRCHAKLPVHVTYFTDSAGSHKDHPDYDASLLRDQRLSESLQAMEMLGLKSDSIHFLGAPDGRLKDLSPTEKTHWQGILCDHLSSIQPTEVFLPSRADNSSEHEAMFTLVCEALRQTGLTPRVYEFAVWAWWNPLFLRILLTKSEKVWRQSAGPYAIQKLRLLRCYRSQVEPIPPQTEPLLSSEFLSAFGGGSEYFFESTLPS